MDGFGGYWSVAVACLVLHLARPGGVEGARSGGHDAVQPGNVEAEAV